jgi:hypothetical protein
MSIKNIISQVNQEEISRVKANLASLKKDGYSLDTGLVMMAYD